MGYFTALFAVIARLFRPSQATHGAPFGRVMGLVEELRRTRSSRVRRYAVEVPPVAGVAPLVPAPRKPADDVRTLPRVLPTAHVPHDYVPVVEPLNVAEPAELVRGHYRALEAKRERERVDRQRLAVAVLIDLADRVERVEVSA